jgi:hypothetical protein
MRISLTTAIGAVVVIVLVIGMLMAASGAGFFGDAFEGFFGDAFEGFFGPAG